MYGAFALRYCCVALKEDCEFARSSLGGVGAGAGFGEEAGDVPDVVVVVSVVPQAERNSDPALTARMKATGFISCILESSLRIGKRFRRALLFPSSRER